ncbi:MAG: alpha/beta hydrolase [Methanobacterium sp.]
MEKASKMERKGKMNKNVMFIHGLWMTPLSWEYFTKRFQELGYNVMAPAWPGHEGKIEEVRKNAPSALADLGLAEIIENYKKIIQEMDEPPILIGHSFGGLIVQILLDNGFGKAGVAIDPAPPKGIHTITYSELKSAFPVLKSPSNRHKVVGLTFDQFKYAFANTMSEEDAKYAYDRYAVPDTGRVLFEDITDDFNSKAPDTVDYKNDNRGPLLLIAGSKDHTVPERVVQSNYGKYKESNAVTDFMEFPGRSHLIIAQEGWDEVADFASEWISQNVT